MSSLLHLFNTVLTLTFSSKSTLTFSSKSKFDFDWNRSFFEFISPKIIVMYHLGLFHDPALDKQLTMDGFWIVIN